MTAQIIDANINRVAEGLRVIEDFLRFIVKHKPLTNQLSKLRKTINESEDNKTNHLMARQTENDMRAKEIPRSRSSLKDLLIANFKRVEEGLRVLEEYTGNPIYNAARYDTYMLEKNVILLAEKPPIQHGIYLISSEIDILREGMKWGCSLVQLRDKAATKDQIYNKASQLKAAASQFKVPWIINDFIDIAQLLDADGLHTGQDDLPISRLRQLMGEHKLLGRTTHCLEQGLIAQNDGADYVSVGPLWETPSKPGRSGIGFEYLNQATDRLQIPYVAIGGINQTNIEQVMNFSPPLVGVIRDYKAIPKWQNTYFKTVNK